jgi:hypothetical protein
LANKLKQNPNSPKPTRFTYLLGTGNSQAIVYDSAVRMILILA